MLMHRVYKVGLLHELVTKNPAQHVESRSKTDYCPVIVTPAQSLTILQSLSSPLHYIFVLTCAATALGALEILSLRWADILWSENRIRVSKRWAKGQDGHTETEASDGHVLLQPLLADRLRSWRAQLAVCVRQRLRFSIIPGGRAQATLRVELCLRLSASSSYKAQSRITKG
jgi:integrase